jgi:transposase
MGKIKVLGLSEAQKQQLEMGYREGKSHAFRKRCQLVLLKEEGRTSKEVAGIVKMCEMSVNNWIQRYQHEGIEGLNTKEGRGRKPLLCKEKDSEAVRKAVQANRQSLSMAKAAFEAQGGAKVSDETLCRFLKVLTADTNV